MMTRPMFDFGYQMSGFDESRSLGGKLYYERTSVKFILKYSNNKINHCLMYLKLIYDRDICNVYRK